MRRANALVAACCPIRQRPVRAACCALLGTVVLGLLLGCAPTHGTGATGGATRATAPTARAVPCPAATVTASAPQQRLAAAVAALVGSVPCLDTAYTAVDHTAMVTVTLGGLVPTTAA